GTPGMLAVPVAVIGTELPLSCPRALPVMVMLPAHSMKKFPASVVSVWLVTVHWKFPHDEALGPVRLSGAQVPSRFGPDVGGVPPPPPLSVLAGVGASTLLWRSNPQALDSMAARGSAIYSEGLFVIIYSFRIDDSER